MTENKGHILIVEDEASLREITAERLSEHGYRVTQADTGETACSLLTCVRYCHNRPPPTRDGRDGGH